MLKRKRDQEVEQPSLSIQNSPSSKKPRISAPSTTQGQSQEAERNIGVTDADPVESWILHENWPREYFEQDDQVRKSLLEHDSWLEDQMGRPPPVTVQYVEINGFTYPRPIAKTPTLRRKQSDLSLTETSDPKNREKKSAAYRDTRYETLLAVQGSFLRDFNDDPPKSITNPGQKLLNKKQAVPQNSLFRDDLFRRFCREIANRNEAMIIQDLSRLLVPSAKNLAIYGDKKLDILIENINEAWTGSIPVEGPRPQPDYSVGFSRSAFTEKQLNNLDPLVGTVFDTSFFVATYRMYFPFFTSEVKCGAAALDVADRQNAHSMTIAVRAVVELYRAVKREKELHMEILAFSISHDHRSVRIYGHYPVIDGKKTTYYRHTICEFIFMAMDGKEKWTAYKFTKSLYDTWMPIHHKRICSAIDQLPSGVDFEVSSASGLQCAEKASGLSADMGSLDSSSDPSNVDMASQMGHEDDAGPPIIPQTATPDTSGFTEEGQRAAKRAKENRITT